MFGYVRPARQELKVREWEEYNAAYCGLCHTLGRRYGFFPRLFLNYDFAFLAMLLAPPEKRPTTEGRRCVACPHKKKCVVVQNTGLEVAADESVILTYHQLLDKAEDSGGWKGLGAKLLAALLKPSYRKAASWRPEFDRAVVENLIRLHKLEKEDCPTLDEPADTFAVLLRAAAPPTGEAARDRAMEQLLYHVGRWIYLLDAWDDWKADRAAGNYNPLPLRFPDGPEHHEAEVKATLDRSIDLAVSAYHLLELGCWSPIVGNILYMGLPAVEEAVFRGTWKKKNKNTAGEVSYERSL